MKRIQNGLVAVILALTGCASQSGSLQSFRELIRSPRPSEYSSMQVPVSNGNVSAELYLAPEGYTISLDGNPFFMHTEKDGNALVYTNPKIGYYDFNCDDRVDVVISNGNANESNYDNVDVEYQNRLSEIGQERVQRVWEYRWR